MIRFYNTMTRRKEDFKSIKEGVVGLYTCGPTVYDLAHIGNFRAYIFEDLLHRYLEYAGYRVLRVMNITDVDDKTIAGAHREGISLGEYTERYTRAFMEDMETLRLKRPDHLPRATEHIQEMVSLVKKLLEKGYAYEKEGAIYYSIAKFPPYGKLSGIDLSAIKPGARVEVDEYNKEDVRDFALWKEEKEEDVSWNTELGRGRPGWHIECSAMSMKYLGESFDIHTGGVDNIFPHHENEIAQSEAATDKKFVNYWMHCAHLLVNSEKMSKSKGNFYTLRDITKKGYNPVAVRYLLLSTHYRDPLNFTEKALVQAENTVKNYNAFYQSLDFCTGGDSNKDIKEEIQKARNAFTEGLADDLNISAALAGVFGLMKSVNVALSQGILVQKDAEEVRSFLDEIDSILFILEKEETKLSEEEQRLLKEREQARKEKNFKRSDEIRALFKDKGILLEDTPYGTRWKKSKK
jgi:cysteinyl-tRNA synthetase